MAVHSGGLEVIAYTDQTLLLLLAFNKEERIEPSGVWHSVKEGSRRRLNAEVKNTLLTLSRETGTKTRDVDSLFRGGYLKRKKKDKWKQEQIFMVCSSGAKRLQLRFSSQLLTASKKQQPMKKKGGGGGDCCRRSCLNPLGPASEREELWRSV